MMDLMTVGLGNQSCAFVTQVPVGQGVKVGGATPLIGASKTAIVQDVQACHVIRKLRKQSLDHDRNLGWLAIFAEWNIVRLDGELRLKGNAVLLRLRFEFVSVPRRKCTAEGQGVDVNTSASKREGERFGFADPSGSDDVGRCVVAQDLR